MPRDREAVFRSGATSLPAANAKRLRKGAKRRSNPFFLSAARWIASLWLAMTTSRVSGCLKCGQAFNASSLRTQGGPITTGVIRRSSATSYKSIAQRGMGPGSRPGRRVDRIQQGDDSEVQPQSVITRHRSRPALSRHHPRKRVIQYSRGYGEWRCGRSDHFFTSGQAGSGGPKASAPDILVRIL
jgi:hypothetical protein